MIGESPKNCAGFAASKNSCWLDFLEWDTCLECFEQWVTRTFEPVSCSILDFGTANLGFGILEDAYCLSEKERSANVAGRCQC